MATVSNDTVRALEEIAERDKEWREAWGEPLPAQKVLLAVAELYEERIAAIEERVATLGQSLAGTLEALDTRLRAFAATLAEFEARERGQLKQLEERIAALELRVPANLYLLPQPRPGVH